jgi:hypothetical protein
MRLRYFLPFVLLSAVISCAPTAPATAPIEFTDPTAEYHGNVSALYGISTSNTELAFDLLWKDSMGRVTSLSEHKGKPMLVVFWMISHKSSDSLISLLDSLQQEMGDSLFVLAVADDRTPHSFATGVFYDTTNHLRLQLVTDSLQRAHVQYSQLSQATIGHPETFVLKPDGHFSSTIQGYSPESGLSPRLFWQDVIRKFYK